MATPDVHIRRCHVRLVRSAADGAALLEREDHLAFARRMQPLVVGMIEQALAKRLAREGHDIDIARLDIALALPADVQHGALPLARAAIRERIDAALGAAVTKARAAGQIVRHPEPAPSAPRTAKPAPAGVPDSSDEILTVLVDWFEQRQLALRLSLLGPLALARLFERIRHTLHALRPDRAEAGHPAASAESGTMQAQASAAAEARLRDWIAHAALWATRRYRPNKEEVPREELAQLLDQGDALAPLANRMAATAGFPVRRDGSLAKGETASGPQTVAPQVDGALHRSGTPAPPPPSQATTGTPTMLRNGRHDVSCALPWLALLRLAEHGVLAGMSHDDPALPALAYAIALKSQPAPSPGRPWSEEATNTAALAAGLAQPLDGAALAAAAGQGDASFDLVGSGVNAAMRPALVELATMPALYTAGHVVVFDPVGFYPAGAAPAATLPCILGGAHALLTFPVGDAAGLRAAEEAGLKAVCQGLPAAREGFARLDGPRGWRGMANVPAETLTGHAGALPHLGERAERAQAVWLELTERRPLAAPASAAQVASLDRCAAFLAGFALADVAYRLSENDQASWRDPDPLLALDRFGDLSARVDVTDGEIAVTLPLGARFADLFAAHLLDVMPRLPWLGGRVLRVGGG